MILPEFIINGKKGVSDRSEPFEKHCQRFAEGKLSMYAGRNQTVSSAAWNHVEGKYAEVFISNLTGCKPPDINIYPDGCKDWTDLVIRGKTVSVKSASRNHPDTLQVRSWQKNQFSWTFQDIDERKEELIYCVGMEFYPDYVTCELRIVDSLGFIGALLEPPIFKSMKGNKICLYEGTYDAAKNQQEAADERAAIQAEGCSYYP